MNKLTLIAFLIFYSSIAYSQQELIAFKKGKKTIALYRKGSYIAFQLKNLEWFCGFITKVQNDSFYVKPLIVRYSWAGSDTLHYSERLFTLNDIYAMPKKGVQIDNLNGHFKYELMLVMYIGIG